MFRPLVGILREVHNKEYITKVFEPMHKCKMQEAYCVCKILVYIYMHLLVSLPYVIGLTHSRGLFKKICSVVKYIKMSQNKLYRIKMFISTFYFSTCTISAVDSDRQTDRRKSLAAYTLVQQSLGQTDIQTQCCDHMK